MRKKYIFTFLFIALLMTGCQTTSFHPPRAGEGELPPDSIEPVEVSITLGDDVNANVQNLFDQAIDALIMHDWQKAIDLLVDAHIALDSTYTTVFQQIIESLRYNPDAAVFAFEALERIERISPGIAFEKSLWETDPFRLEWRTDMVELSWITREDVGWIDRLTYPRSLPIVEVLVNGVSLRLVLDTGANRSFLFACSARRAGIERVSEKTININTSTDTKAAGQYGVIEHMQLGRGLHIYNDPVLLVDRPPSFTGDIDGLIGWTVLSQLVMEFDRAQDTIRLYPEFPEEPGITNYTWLREPMIVLHAGDEGFQMLFFLDTGADFTSFTPRGIRELAAEITGTGHKTIGGLGENQKRESQTINLDGLFLNRKELVFESHRNSSANTDNWHGVIGSDIAWAGLVRFNFPAGRVIFEPYAEENVLGLNDKQ